jgi:hypothetical protein
LRYADAQDRRVRSAALTSLRTLAAPETLVPLMKVAANSASASDREPVLQALYAVCRAESDKEQLARSILGAMDELAPDQRRQLLPLLAGLGTPAALRAAEESSRATDPEMAKEALRALAEWPSAAPAARLLEVARASSDVTVHALALRGAIAVAAHEPDLERRLDILRQSLNVARRAEEQKQALGQIGQISVREALDLALGRLAEPEIAAEAGIAALSVAESLAATDPQLADAVAQQVLAASDAPEVFRRAWLLRAKPQTEGPRIREWLVSGPFHQGGVTGAQAIFQLEFPPEQPGQTADWKPLPAQDHVNLAALYPGQENCVAYLKARIIAPEAAFGALLLGSDDGVKAWLNGEVVHSNNVDRGEVPDQDVAPVRLRQGANELLLKVSQGGGGWSVTARIVGANGQPIPGLRVESHNPG